MYLILSGLIELCLVLYYLTLPYLNLPYLVLSFLVLCCLNIVLSCLGLSYFSNSLSDWCLPEPKASFQKVFPEISSYSQVSLAVPVHSVTQSSLGRVRQLDLPVPHVKIAAVSIVQEVRGTGCGLKSVA